MQNYIKNNLYTILLIVTFYICTTIVLYTFAETPSEPCHEEELTK